LEIIPEVEVEIDTDIVVGIDLRVDMRRSTP